MTDASKETSRNAKSTLAAWAATAALAAIFLAAALVFAGRLTLESAKTWMLGATLLWFAAAPLWLLRRSSGED